MIVLLWEKNPIAGLKKGSDYLSPEIDIIADDALDNNAKLRLLNFLNKWLVEYTNNVWGDLIKLNNYKISNQYLRGLVFNFMKKMELSREKMLKI